MQRISNSAQVKKDLKAISDPKRAANLAWFFKTAKGEYGEGDRFLGVTVPQGRAIALRHRDLPFPEVARLLASGIHEHRFVALAILVLQFKRGTASEREGIVNFYLAHTARINNWDLVDASAPYILGQYLLDRPREVLHQLVASPNLWERRIAIVATFAFMKAGQIDDVYRVASELLDDKHDLIHKAVGWALRESGKVSRSALLQFLEKNYKETPRTALRYAIEHLPPAQRKEILAGKFR